MLVSDVPPRQATVHVRASLGDDLALGSVKTPSADRRITVGPSTVAVLAAHLRTYGVGQDGLVFHHRGQPVSRQRAGYAWRTAVAGMDVRDRSGWHDLRHHHASLLIASGLSVRAVADRLGHANASETLQTYAHLWPSDEDAAVAAVERALAGL